MKRERVDENSGGRARDERKCERDDEECGRGEMTAASRKRIEIVNS